MQLITLISLLTPRDFRLGVFYSVFDETMVNYRLVLLIHFEEYNTY